MLYFHHSAVLTPGGLIEAGAVLVEGKRLVAVGRADEIPCPPGAELIDGAGGVLAPGFIDLHVHGAMGHEVMDADPAGLQAMARFFAEHGVTAFLPTTWTASREAIRRALKTVADMPATTSGAAVLGAHLEGPYLNPEKCGAQAARFIRGAQRDEALEFLDTGVIRLLALAPEFAENEWLIDECARRGITVSAAHTAATYEQMVAAVGRGLRHATHTFNAMVGLGHHEPGTVGAALALPEIACELIADNIHVHPATMKVMVAAKGPERVILVTDAIRAAGLPEGEYQLDDRGVQVSGGAVRLPNGSLAGSVLTMDAALRNLLRATGLSLRAAWPMTSLNAARAIGLDSRTGSLEAGKDADLVLLDTTLSVQLTVVAGEVVFRKK